MAARLEGKPVAESMEEEARRRAAAFRDRAGRPPSLVVLLAGDDPASQVYVSKKEQACERAGIRGETRRLPDDVTTERVLQEVRSLNADDSVDGILVQLPLPGGADSGQVLDAIDPAKDVDGFHAVNVGRLTIGDPVLPPCTPAGIVELLRHYEIGVRGKEAVVLGRSNIVGKPLALLLLHQHATVTICHSRTQELPEVCRRAELLFVAVGRAGMVTADYVREGATVVDVGIHRITEAALAERLWGGTERFGTFEKKGALLVGDVDYRSVEAVARAITPVPGGVGVLTVAQLLRNTVAAAEARLQ
jgi:methylenetetrahydrofolate dehydrogenase (NADP+)/methenyltetrahydrofolate cyclohydrolase